ncbi:hypothetical protein SEUCBS140593_004960 [Sporothrix eucalyptigena]|uniref:Uncharacterized protein n=1 Tax=Sporothrix eucalyptigena TaxID=1812306 RepID=A0ABP0BSM0_9PEZI
METLNASYESILNHPLPQGFVASLPPTARLEGLALADDRGPKHLLQWNHDTVLPLVKWSKQIMGLHVGVALSHVYSDADGQALAKLPQYSGGGGNKTVIDHLVGLSDKGRSTLVVGLGRTSSKWKGSVLINNTKTTTDQDLVVFCFGAWRVAGPDPSKEESNDWSVAFMPVPWNTELSLSARHDVLTTELALWWLCMLSLSDGHVDLVKTHEIVPIDAWDKVWLGEERGWVRRHRYSGAEVPMTPPPPPAYDMPEPAQPAAFAAEVGVHNELDFWLHPLNSLAPLDLLCPLDEFFDVDADAAQNELL